MTKEELNDFKKNAIRDYLPKFYDRQGNQIDLWEWEAKAADGTYKVLKQEQVGPYFVSTVWVGIAMNCWFDSSADDVPPIFETMVFCDDMQDDLYCHTDRYSSEEEALIGHEKFVALAKGE